MRWRAVIAPVLRNGCATQQLTGAIETHSLVDGRPLSRTAMRPVRSWPDLESGRFDHHVAWGDSWFHDRVDVAGFIDPDLSAVAAWDVHLETRSRAEIAKLVAERVPWRIERGRLVPVHAGNAAVARDQDQRQSSTLSGSKP